MGRAELQRQISEKRQLMFNEGFLNDGFLVLEELEERRPNFVETIMNYYIPSSTDDIQQLGEILGIQPLNMADLEILVLNLRKASTSIGAGKLSTAIDELLPLFRSNRTISYRLGAALGKVISEHTALNVHLLAYKEMLKQMRMNYGEEDRESVGSNNGD